MVKKVCVSGQGIEVKSPVARFAPCPQTLQGIREANGGTIAIFIVIWLSKKDLCGGQAEDKVQM